MACTSRISGSRRLTVIVVNTNRLAPGLRGRLNYYRRIFSAYLTPSRSQLSFWHDAPEAAEDIRPGELAGYYMSFTSKAAYAGPFDDSGIPLLNYHGDTGLQYNPIAISQYGLGNHTQYLQQRDQGSRRRFISVADWLVDNLEQNDSGVWVWNHHFDWEYRTPLIAPWYSGLAQGQGISLLVRAHKETGEARYMDTARKAFESFSKPTDQGGVSHVDSDGDYWIEEYIVSPPTHILNGFIWASWGLYDYALATGDEHAHDLFQKAVCTIAKNLHLFDIGFWSLYEQSGTRLKMIASPFYHRLHVVQLDVLHQLTGKDIFADTSRQWEEYRQNGPKRYAALAYKALFKLLYY